MIYDIFFESVARIVDIVDTRALLCGVILVCVAIPWWKFVGIM